MIEGKTIRPDFTCFLIEDDVDDQEIFLSVMELVAPSARCITATNGEEAIEKLIAKEVQPDVIFVDINMPKMNGKQFLAECTQLESCKKIPIIVLTTTSDRKSMDETMKLGATDYITKPNNFSSWGTIIREKLRSFILREELANE